MSIKSQNVPLATAAVPPPSLMTQVGMAGSAAVITVSCFLLESSDHPNIELMTVDNLSSEFCCHGVVICRHCLSNHLLSKIYLINLQRTGELHPPH